MNDSTGKKITQADLDALGGMPTMTQPPVWAESPYEPASLPAPPTEDDTARVERVNVGTCPDHPVHVCGCAETRADRFIALAVERARAVGREQGLRYRRVFDAGRKEGLREAEQAVLDERSSWPATFYGRPAMTLCWQAIRALSSATPSAPEGTDDRG